MKNQNKYIGDQQNIEAHFLNLVFCSKYHFCQETVKKVIPTDKYELFCIASGSMYIPSINKMIGQNSVVLIRKFSQAKLEIGENTEIVHIGFEASNILPVLCDEGSCAAFEGFGIFSEINKLYRLSCDKNPVFGIKEAVLLELLCDINDCRKATHSEIALYWRASEWIEKNSVTGITSKDVAAAIGCSCAHLNRVVKAVSGECLSQLVARHRLERIKNLCDSGNISVSEIAQRLDFYSTELLCKFFKYHEGISINRYIKLTKISKGNSEL